VEHPPELEATSEPEIPGSHRLTTHVRRFVGPLTAAAAVLVQVLVGLADLRRPLFLFVSAVALGLLIVLIGWYAYARQPLKAAAALAAGLLVVLLAWFGAPSAAPVAGAPATTTAPNGGGVGESPGIQVEEPSEADAIFIRAIFSPTGWATQVRSLYEPQTVDDPGGEAVISGAWWALSDWCASEGLGSPGRCYDLAGEYVGGVLGRDPRTINAETWYAQGAIGGGLQDAYELTRKFLSLPRSGDYVPELVRDRPGIEWECEPTCTAGYAIAHD
jgi:hypothetical protein